LTLRWQHSRENHMKSKALFITTLLFGMLTTWAQTPRYVTITSTNNLYPASLDIQDGETAELLSSSTETENEPTCTIQKSGLTFLAFARTRANCSSSHTQGSTVAGPARITVRPASAVAALLTIKITPMTYDVNKTIILPPGTNQVYVTLESSTNLVAWADATNGVYGTPDTARFFRIRLSSLVP